LANSITVTFPLTATAVPDGTAQVAAYSIALSPPAGTTVGQSVPAGTLTDSVSATFAYTYAEGQAFTATCQAQDANGNSIGSSATASGTAPSGAAGTALLPGAGTFSFA
jgi:hypothetical protein